MTRQQFKYVELCAGLARPMHSRGGMRDQFKLDEEEGGRWSPMPFGKSIDSGLFDESHLVDEVAAYQDYKADAEGYVELSFDF